MRLCLLFNAKAGTADRIKPFLFHLNDQHRCELRPCPRDGNLAPLVREIVESGIDRLVIAGGDGTVNQVINALPAECPVSLAVLPLGTGNDLARSIGLVPEDIDAASRIALGSNVVPIDIVRVTVGDDVSHFVNVANGGMGGRVAIDVNPEDKQRWGPLAYWMTSASSLVNLQRYKVEIDLDDRRVSTEAYGIAIANGRFVGGGFPIAPQACVDDGLLDITLVPVLPMFELMAAGLNFTLGRDRQDDRIEHEQARRIEVRSTPPLPFSIDGEATVSIDAVFEVIPGAVKIAVGALGAGLKSNRV